MFCCSREWYSWGLLLKPPWDPKQGGCSSNCWWPSRDKGEPVPLLYHKQALQGYTASLPSPGEGTEVVITTFYLAGSSLCELPSGTLMGFKFKIGRSSTES